MLKWDFFQIHVFCVYLYISFVLSYYNTRAFIVSLNKQL